MKELNSLESRRGRRPLDVNNVIYWFKNTRAAVKRAEMKARVTSATSMTSTLTSGGDKMASMTSSTGLFAATSNNNPTSLWPWFHNSRSGSLRQLNYDMIYYAREKNREITYSVPNQNMFTYLVIEF